MEMTLREYLDWLEMTPRQYLLFLDGCTDDQLKVEHMMVRRFFPAWRVTRNLWYAERKRRKMVGRDVKRRLPRGIVKRPLRRKLYLVWLLVVNPLAAKTMMRLDQLAADHALWNSRRKSNSHFLRDRQDGN